MQKTGRFTLSTPVWSAIEATVQWYRNNPAREAS